MLLMVLAFVLAKICSHSAWIISEINRGSPKVPWMVVVKPIKENGLLKVSVIDLFQVRSVSQKRLVTKLGIIDSLLWMLVRKL